MEFGSSESSEELATAGYSERIQSNSSIASVGTLRSSIVSGSIFKLTRTRCVNHLYLACKERVNHL